MSLVGVREINTFFFIQVHLESKIQQRAKDHYLQAQDALQLQSSVNCQLVKVLQVIRSVMYLIS